jgi:hypothetical protein
VNVGGSTGLAYFRPAPQGYEARDITVEDCTFLGSEAAIAFVGVDGAEVRHNTIYRPRRYAFRILQETREPGFVPCRDGRFIDNIVAFRSDEMTLPVNIGTGTAPETFTMARNAWYCLDDPARSRPRLPIPEAEGVYGQDPQFQDAERGDLRLKPGSPLKRAGTRAASPPAGERPRLIVLTDISSLTSGVAEPDDGQSMIRLMFYTNEFDIEGLIATSNLGHGQAVRPDLIERVVDAYGRVQPNLIKHDDRYPGAPRLAGTIKAGQPVAGPKVPVHESIGAGKDTEASEWIINVVDRPDPRAVWVAIWGGSADLAQALWKVRQARSPDALARFLSKLRVHAIADQDATGPWIRENFPGLFVITNLRAMRGMYRGGDTSLSSSRWVEEHIKGHGAPGDLYPDYNGGDIWSRTLGRVRGIKEGDTPSFLALIPNGLSVPERPWLGGWGGRFEGEANRYADVPDRDRETSDDPDPRMVTVYRWRPAFQADFQARLDWSVRPYAEANHPPVVQIRSERERVVAPGEEVVLDAGDSTDPDDDDLRFEWSLYPVSGEGEGLREVVIEGRTSSVARLKVPPGSSGRTIPVLLTVRDDGSPALTRYGRVLVTVGEEK